MNQVKELFRTRLDEDTYRKAKAAQQPVYPLRDKKLTFEQLLDGARLTADGAIVPSQTRFRLYRHVNLVQGTCDCEHWQIHRKMFLDNPCLHYKAASVKTAETILEIEGEMHAKLIEAALVDISNDCPVLRRNYLTWQAIYEPPRVIVMRYGLSDRVNMGSIGLKNRATYAVGYDDRGRYHWTQEPLTRAEREACLFVLGALLREIQSQEREAA